MASNYPKGIDTLTLKNVPLFQVQPGKVIWVNNSAVVPVDGVQGSDGGTLGSYHRPLATINHAVDQCTANRGDVIIVGPGHSETLSSAGVLSLDVAGVAIVGLGHGSLRPKVIADTDTTVKIGVSADNITVANIVFSANFADITACFSLSTAKNFTVTDSCSFTQEATNMNFVAIVETETTDNAADGLTIINCEWIEPDAGTTSMVNVDGDLANLTIEDNYVNLGVHTSDLPALVEVATGKDIPNVSIQRNDVVRLNDANPLLVTFDTGTANTGIIADNKVRHADAAGELLATTTSNIGFFNNLCTAAVDKSGYLIPVADS